MERAEEPQSKHAPPPRDGIILSKHQLKSQCCLVHCCGFFLSETLVDNKVLVSTCGSACREILMMFINLITEREFI